MNRILTSKDGKYTIAVSEIYNGSFNTENTAWVYNHTAQTVSKNINGEILTLKIGDYINDTNTQTIEGFDGKWRILGVESGQLLLTTAMYAIHFNAEDLKYCGNPYEIQEGYLGLQLMGKDGYEKGVDELNSLGAKFNISGKFENGRSIKVSDINKLTGYNPNNVGVNDYLQTVTNGTKYGSGYIDEYENHVSFKVVSGMIPSLNNVNYLTTNSFASTWTQNTANIREYYPIGSATSISGDTVEGVDCNYYYYYWLNTLTVEDTGNAVGINTTSAVFDMLTGNPGTSYWLANHCIGVEPGRAYYGVFSLSASDDNGYVDGVGLWSTSDGELDTYAGVRPVVSLNSTITPIFKSTDSTTGISTYEISSFITSKDSHAPAS